MVITTTKFVRWVRIVTGAGLLSLGLSLTPAYANQPYQERSATSHVDATSVRCQQTADGSSCAATMVYVSKLDKKTTQVCLILDTTIYSSAGWPVDREYESGCASVDTQALSLDRQLSDASLSPIAITVTSTECGEEFCGPEYSRTATLSGQWVGIGETYAYDRDDVFEADGCTFKYGGESIQRSATSQISVDGETVTAYGWMFTSESSAKVHCKK